MIKIQNVISSTTKIPEIVSNSKITSSESLEKAKAALKVYTDTADKIGSTLDARTDTFLKSLGQPATTKSGGKGFLDKIFHKK